MSAFSDPFADVFGISRGPVEVSLLSQGPVSPMATRQIQQLVENCERGYFTPALETISKYAGYVQSSPAMKELCDRLATYCLQQTQARHEPLMLPLWSGVGLYGQTVDNIVCHVQNNIPYLHVLETSYEEQKKTDNVYKPTVRTVCQGELVHYRLAFDGEWEHGATADPEPFASTGAKQCQVCAKHAFEQKRNTYNSLTSLPAPGKTACEQLSQDIATLAANSEKELQYGDIYVLSQSCYTSFLDLEMQSRLRKQSAVQFLGDFYTRKIVDSIGGLDFDERGFHAKLPAVENLWKQMLCTNLHTRWLSDDFTSSAWRLQNDGLDLTRRHLIFSMSSQIN